jgi:hypothetical protein
MYATANFVPGFCSTATAAIASIAWDERKKKDGIIGTIILFLCYKEHRLFAYTGDSG